MNGNYDQANKSMAKRNVLQWASIITLISGEYPPPNATATGILFCFKQLNTNASLCLHSSIVILNLPNLSVLKISTPDK